MAPDERPAKLLARTPVEEAHLQRLQELSSHAQAAAEAANVDLQYEFGPVVAYIAGCQQFLRLHRGGEAPGAVELMLPPDAKAALEAAGYEALEPFGAVFKMFGWTRVEPMAGTAEALDAAVEAALEHARSKGKPKL